MPSEYPPKKDLEKRRSDPNGVYSDQARLTETGALVPGREGSRTAPSEPTPQVTRLARRLDVDADELASKIPPETLRRTRYPLIERRMEDGTTVFNHDLGIVEAPQSLVAPDRAEVPKIKAPKARDGSGKFTK
jgi:hypothetical protein